MAKYKKYSMPLEAWKNFKEKQVKLQDTFKNLTGKKRRIPLSRIILASSRKQLWFDDSEVMWMSRRNGRKS